MRDLGVEFLNVFAMPPVEHVGLAADLGCRTVTVVLEPFAYNPQGYARFSLKQDKGLRREMKAAMQDRGVSVSLGEGFFVQPDADIRDVAADLDVMCELGAPRVNVISFDPDLGRSFDQFGLMAEMAAARGMETVHEFVPCLTVKDLPTALAAVRHVGRPDFRLVIDTMHLFRSGGGAADLAALDPGVIGHVQLCDVPRSSKFASYGEEAEFERLPPGEGEAPLREIMAALPASVNVGIEIPMRSLADAGVGPYERVSRCLEATRRLLAD